MNGWEFMTRNLAVIPFQQGTAVYVDGMLSTIYYELKKLDRLEMTFCGDNPNHDEFIRMFDPGKKVLQILCEVQQQGTGAERVIPIGCSWVELPRGIDGQRAALCGFAFFKRNRHVLDLGRMGIAYWMRGMKIDVIHGVMLADNTVGRRYAAKLGFSESASVPRFHSYRGTLVDAVAVTLEKRDFDPGYDWWLGKQKAVANSV